MRLISGPLYFFGCPDWLSWSRCITEVVLSEGSDVAAYTWVLALMDGKKRKGRPCAGKHSSRRRLARLPTLAVKSENGRRLRTNKTLDVHRRTWSLLGPSIDPLPLSFPQSPCLKTRMQRLFLPTKHSLHGQMPNRFTSICVKTAVSWSKPITELVPTTSELGLDLWPLTEDGNWFLVLWFNYIRNQITTRAVFK